jgi:hypothetical protein
MVGDRARTIPYGHCVKCRIRCAISRTTFVAAQRLRSPITQTAGDGRRCPDQPLTSAASISTNWLEFTTDVNGGMDPDGSSVPDSARVFVRVNRSPASGMSLANAIRLRQMGQEVQPELESGLPGTLRAAPTPRPDARLKARPITGTRTGIGVPPDTPNAVEIRNPRSLGEGRVRAEAPDVPTRPTQARGAQALAPTHLP